MPPSLVVRRGDETLLEYRIPLGRTLIGRSDGCDLAVPDETVSRVHCHLLRRGNEVVLVDRSRYGTFVNGERVRGERRLRNGDLLRMGTFFFVFREEDESSDYARTLPSVPDRTHEPVLGADQQGIVVVRLVLEVTGGPARGARLDVKLPRLSVGGPGSELVVDDPALLPRHFWLEVHQGRPVLLPGEGPLTVDRERVRGLFPIQLREPFQAGNSRFQLYQVRDEEQPTSAGFGEMIGRSEAMRRVFGLLTRMAGYSETVLLQGESGTGKELAARGLHQLGPRSTGPFVPVNCGAITETLFEAELFGHEKGAFTGATSRRDGAFHLADGGTLFLDEVGEIPLHAQAKLLRALESGEVRRVGGGRPDYVDVRVIAATNRDLVQEVQAGRFREDLYFRLAVLTVRLPPLRERPDDIDPLAAAFCKQLSPEARVTPAALRVLQQHPWPGNVRELRNVLTRAYVLHGPLIDANTLSFSPMSLGGSLRYPQLGRVDEEAERALCEAALARHRGNRAAAARDLGLPRTTFLYKLKRLGLA